MIRLDEACKKNATANNYVAFVAKIIRAAGIQAPKFHLYPVPARNKRWLRPEEWLALSGVMAPDLRQIATFSLATGLREANVMLFEWAWLHGNKAFLPASVTKTGDAYGIPLNKSAIQAIEERKSSVIRHAKYVFLNGGNPWTRWTYYTGVKQAAKASGLLDVNVHTFRHTFASWLAQAGTPDAIRKRLGCWSLGSSADAGYLHFDVEPLRPFAEKLDVYLNSVSPDSRSVDCKEEKEAQQI
jgi:integrase